MTLRLNRYRIRFIVVEERNELIVRCRRCSIDRDAEIRLTYRLRIRRKGDIVIRTLKEEISIGIDMTTHQLSRLSR